LLLDVPSATLLHLPLLLTDKRYRTKCIDKATDPFNAYFWREEFEKYSEKFRQEAIAPIQNKVGQFVGNPHLRAILGQPSTITPDDIMNKGKILVCNLSKRMGTEPSHLLGALLTSAFFQAAERRATIPESERRDFTLYCDEFQNFGTEAFGTILSEARKYRLSLVVANQFIGQLPESLKQAVLGNVGTLVSFRVGSEDADLLAAELDVNRQTLIDLPNFELWMKRLADGVPTSAMHGRTSVSKVPGGRLDAVVAWTRARHSTLRAEQEERFKKLYA
jgi:hypothetical protein